MDSAPVDSETLELLSRITGNKLEPQDVTPPLIFLSALIAILVGVMFVDGTVTTTEKQRWQQTIHKFISSQHSYRQLAQQITRGIQEHQIHRKSKYFFLLTDSLSLSERFLLVALGYEMSIADGKIDSREENYLTNIALELGIRAELLDVLESGINGDKQPTASALSEVRDLLSPSRFKAIEALFSKLPTL
ncbi:TerB family tellurite resistance protein [Oscillatoria sp. FACHB-1406]|uniref:TerB family tellurite resistance protein n=1 Tax=Oscillatoria sp. FACHB-1406 TaxID=2692846 RepID=UPI00168894F2|nr:TerB family tellurite resistance protein [Oscillatoria sp. FACHB-1406]MBD2580589.1 TerB family tellurite resistance protein [Oscillatoria sp. FACHB-1406]